jgi:hypothetical protein
MVQGGAQTKPNVIAAQVANFMAFFLEMLVIEPPPDNRASAIAQMCKRFTYDDAVACRAAATTAASGTRCLRASTSGNRPRSATRARC